jgi:hypothetical protein
LHYEHLEGASDLGSETMWVCFNDAFVSAVQDRDYPDRVCVRARNRAHLVRLFPRSAILGTPDADYAYRVFVTKAEFADVLVNRVQTLDYPNFKNSVQDTALHSLYEGFWSAHRAYQERVADRSRHFAWDADDVQITKRGEREGN